MVFYEAPHKLVKTLGDMAAAFGADRRVALCRELTKIHEQVVRTTLGEAAALYEAAPPKGEFVLVVAGYEPPSQPETDAAGALALVDRYRSEGRSLREACKLAASDTGYSKNELYSMALESKK
jgi:16S rRNA (cytidine1402-2'-O)-methyltransferase